VPAERLVRNDLRGHRNKAIGAIDQKNIALGPPSIRPSSSRRDLASCQAASWPGWCLCC
jgi:hypothetical protein